MGDALPQPLHSGAVPLRYDSAVTGALALYFGLVFFRFLKAISRIVPFLEISPQLFHFGTQLFHLSVFFAVR